MNLIGLATPKVGDLWAWTGTDRYGKSRNYQTHAPDWPESRMLAYLRQTYPGLQVTGLRRINISEFIPQDPAKQVEEHAFTNGVRTDFVNRFEAMPDGERRSLIETAMNLPKTILGKWGLIPDPLTNAVVDAIHIVNERQLQRTQNKPKSIRDQFKSLRT